MVALRFLADFDLNPVFKKLPQSFSFFLLSLFLVLFLSLSLFATRRFEYIQYLHIFLEQMPEGPPGRKKTKKNTGFVDVGSTAEKRVGHHFVAAFRLSFSSWEGD